MILRDDGLQGALYACRPSPGRTICLHGNQVGGEKIVHHTYDGCSP